MYWLITYQQNTGRQYKMVMNVTNSHPADWLLLANEVNPDCETVIIFSIVISLEQYKALAKIYH